MSDDLKKDIKKLLFMDTLISYTLCISKILDDVEEELDCIFDKPIKCRFELEDLFKQKNCK